MIRKIKLKLDNKIRIKSVNKTHKCKIALKAFIDNISKFEGRNEIGANTKILKTSVGYATYIGTNCSFIQTNIGKYCSISSNIKIIAGNHPTSKYISTHPLFYTKKSFAGIKYDTENEFEEYSYSDKVNEKLCTIGNDVWIGEGVSILNGVSIGNGAVIAAGAVVTKNIEPYSIVGGVPAKIIKYRFNESEIKYLEKIKWWNKNDAWIKKFASKFNDINELKEELENEGV